MAGLTNNKPSCSWAESGSLACPVLSCGSRWVKMEWGKDTARNCIMIQMINYIYTVNKYQQSTQVKTSHQPLGLRNGWVTSSTTVLIRRWHVCDTCGSGQWLHDQCSGQEE